MDKLESEVKTVVHEIEPYAQGAAKRIGTAFKAGFNRVRRWFSKSTQYLVAKIREEEKKKHNPKVGPNTSSFKSELTNGLHDAEKGVDDVIKGLRDSAKAFINEAKDIIEKVKEGMVSIAVDTTKVVQKVASDSAAVLDTIAKDAFTGLERFASDFIKEVKADVSFAYKHKGAIASAAIITAVNPTFILCFAGSIGILIFAGNFQP
jgi:dGTP triphosphohydrolase